MQWNVLYNDLRSGESLAIFWNERHISTIFYENLSFELHPSVKTNIMIKGSSSIVKDVFLQHKDAITPPF